MKQERYMCAMDAVSHRAVPEISRGSSAGNDDDDATQKGRLLRRAALRISWLLVLVLRNASTSATPLDLICSGDRMAVSRLVTEDDCLTPEQNPKFVCTVHAFSSCGPVFVPVTKAHPRPISLIAVAYKRSSLRA